MEFVKINNKEYPATISGLYNDSTWDGRETKTIKFVDNAISYEEIIENFIEGASWSIISLNEGKIEEFDNSDFCLAGPVTNLRTDGAFTVKMGKLSELESLLEKIYGKVGDV